MTIQIASPARDEAAALRAAMRQLASGVSVLTLGEGAERNGFTATSVSSLSMDPPRLIACLNKNSSSYSRLRVGAGVGVNVLAAHQRAIADRFAGRGGAQGAARYEGAEWIAGQGGGSLLVGALAAVDGVVEELIERHSHVILVIRPLACRVSEHQSALLYWRGLYDALSAPAFPSSAGGASPSLSSTGLVAVA
jgi:flavin reductase (DIM6/NTAB) family NADH-FMN oxidoreductase RutF